MLVLGIETSCDETAAAVVREDGLVLSDVIHSQIALHAVWGGVVPELASRDHMRKLRPVVEQALADANVQLTDLAGIAVTCQPGLTGALLVGVQLARGLGWGARLPVVGVDHVLGHLLAAQLRYADLALDAAPEPPFVGLVVSGGHTALYRVDGPTTAEVRELGSTRDDAAGEAFDKVAKLLGLGYPGGPLIDKLAAQGDPTAFELARAMASRTSLEFSFSGLKSSVARWVEQHGVPTGQPLLDLCATFQRRVVDVLVGRAVRACEFEGLTTLVLGGGVSANRELRERVRTAALKRGIRVVVPPPRSCTDNAAMIGWAGVPLLRAGENHLATLAVSPRSAISRLTRKGRGRR